MVWAFNILNSRERKTVEMTTAIRLNALVLKGTVPLSLSKEQYTPATVYGFDVNDSSPKKIYPAETADFMSYGRPRWPSKWNYNRLFAKFVWPDSPSANVKLSQRDLFAGQTVLIDGLIQLNGPVGQIGSVIVDTTPGTISFPLPGDYSIRLENSLGAELARFSFNPIRVSEDPSTAIISLLLPWDSNAKRIVLLHNEDVLDSREASANSPTVDVTFPNGGELLTGPSTTFTWTAADLDGDALSYMLEYSTDDGTTWQTLAVSWNAPNHPVDLTKLHGSNQALIRVTASDGFNCAQAQSQGTFTVPNHAPTADVSSPEDKHLYVGDQTIILEGTGSDIEDGAVNGPQLTWTSNLNGPLGTGLSLAFNAMTLQEGTHTITLTATDNTNENGSASISIRVFRNRPALPATLSELPGELTFRLTNTQTATRTVAIRNSGDGDLGWSAGTNQAWIQLGSASGSTPFNLEITADATGLAVGDYIGQVTIDAPGAVDSPQVVTVHLLVQGDSTPTPTAAPSPTVFPSPTPSATPTVTPVPVASPTPTPTPTATPTATPAGTPTATPPTTPTPTPALVGNVSTRLAVGADDNALIEGFIVQGPAGSSKKILVRAIGPSLGAIRSPGCAGKSHPGDSRRQRSDRGDE